MLIHGECLEEMDKLIADGVKVDAIITDPPYGTMNTDGGRKLGIETWDMVINQKKMTQKCNSLLRTNGALLLFSQEPYTSKLITETYGNLPFSYRLNWIKDSFANALGGNKAPVNYVEDICVFFKKHTKHDFQGFHPIRPYAKEVLSFIGKGLKEINNTLGHRSAEHFFYVNTTQFNLCIEKTYNELIDVFNIDKMEGFRDYSDISCVDSEYRSALIIKMTADTPKVFNLKEGKKYKSNVLEYKKDYQGFHPTQKPVKLLEDLIKTYTNEGDTVLDFTMGSGTTGVACNNLNREFIGIEKDDKYFKIAQDRVDVARIGNGGIIKI